MRIALAVTIMILVATTLPAQEAETWGNAVFDSAAQAYAFAASVESPLVVRTAGQPPRYVVYVERTRAVLPPDLSTTVMSPPPVVTDFIRSATGSVTISSPQTSLIVTNGAVLLSAGAYMTATHFRTYGGYEDAGGNQVVGWQQPSIPDADASLSDLTAKFNRLLAAIRAHGLVAK